MTLTMKTITHNGLKQRWHGHRLIELYGPWSFTGRNGTTLYNLEEIERIERTEGFQRDFKRIKTK